MDWLQARSDASINPMGNLFRFLPGRSLFLKVALIFLGLSSALFYQNCSPVRFESMNEQGLSLSSLSCTEGSNCGSVTVPPCLFNGAVVPEGSSVTAFLNSSAQANQACREEQRTCEKGSLSGSFLFATCSPGPAQACLFNGVTIQDGESVTAYMNSSAEQCEPQERICRDGVLSGSYSFPSCNESGPKACLFQGQAIESGGSVVAYERSNVEPGALCKSQVRSCLNGQLSGSFAFASCVKGQPLACQFNGQNVVSGASVTAFLSSSVPFGKTCISSQRTCQNGLLSGSGDFANCEPEKELSCLFNGRTLASGESVVAYAASEVAYGQTCQADTRVCKNGVLSGSGQAGSCQILPAKTCRLNDQVTPHGAAVVAYFAASVPFGKTCESENRSCNDGTLSGSATFLSCQVTEAKACLFNGVKVVHNSTIDGYAQASVPFGSECLKQTRTCVDGSLTGTAEFAACVVGPAKTCVFGLESIEHGQSVEAFASSSVPFGQSCAKELRSCTNGVLSGSHQAAACQPLAPADCSLNGVQIKHGGDITAYSSASVPFGKTCMPQKRTCDNGVLSGSATSLSCQAEQPLSCQFNGSTISHTQSTLAFASAVVPYGQNCVSENRVCNNGQLGGTFVHGSCQVEVPSELWTWLPTFYQTTCPYLCDGQQQVRCEGSGCPGPLYWHYGAAPLGVPPYAVGASQVNRPPFIGSIWGSPVNPPSSIVEEVPSQFEGGGGN